MFIKTILGKQLLLNYLVPIFILVKFVDIWKRKIFWLMILLLVSNGINQGWAIFLVRVPFQKNLGPSGHTFQKTRAEMYIFK